MQELISFKCLYFKILRNLFWAKKASFGKTSSFLSRAKCFLPNNPTHFYSLVQNGSDVILILRWPSNSHSEHCAPLFSVLQSGISSFAAHTIFSIPCIMLLVWWSSSVYHLCLDKRYVEEYKDLFRYHLVVVFLQKTSPPMLWTQGWL